MKRKLEKIECLARAITGPGCKGCIHEIPDESGEGYDCERYTSGEWG